MYLYLQPRNILKTTTTTTITATILDIKYIFDFLFEGKYYIQHTYINKKEKYDFFVKETLKDTHTVLDNFQFNKKSS